MKSNHAVLGISLAAVLCLQGCGCERESASSNSVELERVRSELKVALAEVERLQRELTDSNRQIAQAREAMARMPNFNPEQAMKAIERLKAELKAMRDGLAPDLID